MKNGLMHIYYGDGKGKTTAAIGLAIRAAGAGQSVTFCQFMKGNETSELQILKDIPNIQIIRSEREYPFFQQMTEAKKREITVVHNQIIKKLIAKNQTKAAVEPSQLHTPSDMIILDELTYPLLWDLIDKEAVKELVKMCRKKVEIVITGRSPEPWLMDCADYITEMKKQKHPFDYGMDARLGIEY